MELQQQDTFMVRNWNVLRERWLRPLGASKMINCIALADIITVS